MKKAKKILPWIIAIVVIILFLRQCEKTDRYAKQRDNAAEYFADSIEYYKNELNREVATKTALKGDNQQLQTLLSALRDSTAQLQETVRKFRTVDAAGQVDQATRIDTVKIAYRDTVPFEFERNWHKSNPYYSLSGTSNQSGITIDSLSIPNRLTFAIGEKKQSFWRTEYRIEVVNSNPHIRTVGLESFSRSEPRKRLGLGLSVGYGIGGIYAGIGLNYNLLQF